MKNIATLILLFVCSFAQAQNLSEDSKSKSSLFLPVDNINFQSTKLNLGFNYTYGLPALLDLTNTTNSDSIKPSRIVIGVNASGKNSDASTILFKTGRFTPESNLDLKIGWRGYCGKSQYQRLHSIRENSEKIQKNYSKIVENNIAYINLISNTKIKLNTQLKTDPKLATKAFAIEQKEWINNIDSLKNNFNKLKTVIIQFQKKYNSQSDFITNNIEYVFTNMQEVRKLLDESSYLDSTNNNLANENRYLRNSVSESSGNQFVVYAGISRSDRSFKLLNETASSLEDRYQKQNFTGARIYGGANLYMTNRTVIGLQFGWEKKDNYDDLDIFEIESTTALTDSTRTDKQTKKFNVASGTYGMYEQYPVMFDAIHFFSLPGKKINEGAFSIYGRAIFRNNPDLKIKNSFTVGGSVYLLKNADFVGGIYLEHTWPKGETDNRNVYQRLTLGISTSFNIGGFDYDKLFGK